MASKGAIAKEEVINKIAKAFGSDYIGVYDKKVYVWGDDGGEKVQICLALTCPKNPVGQVKSISTGQNFENMGETVASPSTFEPAEITEDERENVRKIMEALGL